MYWTDGNCYTFVRCVPPSQCSSGLSGSGLQVPRVPFVSCTSYNADCEISLAPDYSLSLSLTRTLIQLRLQQALSNKTSVWNVLCLAKLAAALARAFQTGFSHCCCCLCPRTPCPSQDLLPSLWGSTLLFWSTGAQSQARGSPGEVLSVQ